MNLLAVLCALLTLVDLEKKPRKTKTFLGKKLTCHAETGKKDDRKEVQVTLTKISNTRNNRTIPHLWYMRTLYYVGHYMVSQSSVLEL